MGLISLGNLILDGFEVPSRVEFGGRQRMVVHKLLGGVRIIDVLGRDDAPLQWRGVLSGTNASDRARTLDAMRVSGATQLLTWDVFCYAVVISQLHLSFCNPWWIPYEISCTVQENLAQNIIVSEASFLTGVDNDLAQVGQLLGPSVTVDVEALSTLLSSGSTGQQQVLQSTEQLQSTIMQSIDNAESGLTSNDIEQLVSSAGSLAQLCCAQGYLDRSIVNITDMGS